MQGFHPIQSSVLLVILSIARTLKGLYFVIIYCEMFVLVYFPMPCVVFAQFLYVIYIVLEVFLPIFQNKYKTKAVQTHLM